MSDSRKPLTLLVIHDGEHGMRFGGDHPTDARRHQLAVALCRESGLFELPNVAIEPGPPPLGDEALARVFAPAFIKAIRRYSAQPILASGPDAGQWGIGGDNNAYAGMHEDSARACSACARASEAIIRQEAIRALVPAGGAHHGLANRAMGFGMYNETAIAVQTFLDAGLDRVAYIDLDVHHGNGTQDIFYDDPRVLTVSVHESGKYLFPSSGFADETGGPGAPGSSVNVALPPDSGNDAYRRTFDEIVAPVVREFDPQAIVAQCGVDHHHADPLAHMLTTIDFYPELWRRLRELADEVCGGRIVAMGGGGYNPCLAPPRAWAALAWELAGVPIDSDRPLPESWREVVRAAGCPEPAKTWLEDVAPEPDEKRDQAAAEGLERALAATKSALGIGPPGR